MANIHSLSITDNTSTPKDKFKDLHDLVDIIADKTLEQLAKNGENGEKSVFVFPEILKDADDLSKEQMILQSVNNDYRSGNVMGFLGYKEGDKDQRLEIRSRFSSANNGGSVTSVGGCDGNEKDSAGTGETDYFLLYMLQRVLDIPNIVDLKTNADRENRLFNWLLFLFPFYLKNAVRKGIYKTYIRRQYNDANVKGAIDVARHIKKNIPFLGRIAYNQREHSGDNYLLKLIRLTIDYIKSKPFGNSILSRVRDEIQLITGATPGYAYKDKRKIIDENKKHAVRHAYYHEYRALQQLCLWILQDEKHLIGQGSQQIYGILFDGAWLWEEYINKLISEYFYHPQNKARNGAQELFTGETGKTGLIYPDFIGKSMPVVADAKYKYVDRSQGKDNISGSDYLQILAYMFRFKATLGLFIYPKPNNDIPKNLWLNEGYKFKDVDEVKPRDDPKVLVIKYGLEIPQNAVDYNDFFQHMKACEEIFQNELKGFIDKLLQNKK